MDCLQNPQIDLFEKLQTEKEKAADLLQSYESSKNMEQRQLVYDRLSGRFKETQRGEEIEEQEIVVTKENLPVLEELSI